MDSKSAPAMERAALLKPANAQQRSPFFTRLPPEIRAEIYGQYCANKTIHLIQNTPRNFPRGLPAPRPNHSQESLLSKFFSRTLSEPEWVHVACHHLGRGLDFEPYSDFTLRFCFYDCVAMGKFDDPGRVDTSILKVCKRMYEEAWPVLYSRLLVHIIDRSFSFEGFLWNDYYPPPMHFVRNVALSWYLTQARHVFLGRNARSKNRSYDQLYRDFWATVAQLPELRYLRVDVYVFEMGSAWDWEKKGGLGARKLKGQQFVASNVEPWLQAMDSVKHVSRIDVNIGDCSSQSFNAAGSFEERKEEFGLNNSNFKDMQENDS